MGVLSPSWVFVSAALGLVGSIRYAVATVRGTARPNVVTWSLWALAPLIGFAAQLAAGVGLPAVPTLSAGLGPLVVLGAAAAGRHLVVRIGPFDVACGVVAVVALGVWFGLGQAPLAVLFAVLADAVAAVPTIRKAWRDPAGENALFYVLVGLGAVLTLLTITSPEPSAWAFAAYMLAVTALIAGVLAVRRPLLLSNR